MAWSDVWKYPPPRDETWFVAIDRERKQPKIARWDNDHDGFVTATDELLCLDGPNRIHLHYSVWSPLPDNHDRSSR